MAPKEPSGGTDGFLLAPNASAYTNSATGGNRSRGREDSNLQFVLVCFRRWSGEGSSGEARVLLKLVLGLPVPFPFWQRPRIERYASRKAVGGKQSRV